MFVLVGCVKVVQWIPTVVLLFGGFPATKWSTPKRAPLF